MKPISRSNLRQRLNQIKMDRERIKEAAHEIFELQQTKSSLELAYSKRVINYELDQRTWYESTHETLVTSKKSKSSEPSLDEITAQLLREALAAKGITL